MKEQVSAMMDGELADHECESCVKRIKEDPNLRAETWDVYHMIGDALRGQIAPAVVERVREKLDAEPTILAPRRGGIAQPSRRGAWYALSAAASIAAVGLVGWMALPLFDFQPGSGQPAVATAVQAVPQAAAVVPAAHGVNDYLLAHQRFSSSLTMSGIAPYVRTVTEEKSGAR